MSAPIVFMDTETTGLALTDDIWEFAAVRRDPDGSETEYHAFVEHSADKCRRLPESFSDDHRARFPAPCSNRINSRNELAHLVRSVTRGAHIVGAVPNFDTERLALLMAEFKVKPEWHYHLIDVENLAVGYIYGTGGGAVALDPPWTSDDLSRLCGVEPPTADRHTAMGDVRWAMALYDAITVRQS